MMLKFTKEEFQSPNIIHGFLTKNIGGTHQYFQRNPGEKNESLENVAINHKLALNASGIEASRINIPFQIHSNIVLTLDEDLLSLGTPPEADGFVTNKPGIVIGIVTADCVPILFADSKNRVIGAAHAGWKGARNGIIENTYNAMMKLGAKNISACIGPCIHQESYEISSEFYDNFMDETSENKKFFAASNRPDHYQFNLPGYAAEKLSNTGIKKIYNLNKNTYLDNSNFFSFRRFTHDNSQDYGSLVSLIAIK
jgi:YfiH family protein